MKTTNLFLIICLTLFVKTGFSQPSIDSLLLKFISNFESKVVYNTQYVNPPSKALWSKIHDQYIDFYEPPSYYGEAYNEGKYLIEKTCFGDTSSFEIIVYNKNGYNWVQCYFSVIKGNYVETSSIIFAPHHKPSYLFVYDRAHNFSDVTLWSEMIEGQKRIIDLADFQKQAEFLLTINN